MTRVYPIAIWIFTGFLAISTLGSHGAGNAYLAALLVMAFIYSSRPTPA